jgi:arsenate reductase-like glutaredoxin family protein
MKANQVIDKMVEIRDNNALNADQTKYVKQVIEDFTEMGSMFENDEDSMNEVKKFIAKFPNKPQGTRSQARGEATMAKLKDKLSARTQRNKPGANPRFDNSRYVSPKKKSFEIEGIILDPGDEVNDKSSGLTIVVDSFENRPEGIYILGAVKGTNQPVQVLRENAVSPKKAKPKTPKASKGKSAVAEAKAEVAETKAEVKKVVAQAEKKAEKLIETAEKQADKGNVQQAKKTVAKAKEVVQDAVTKANDKTKDAAKDLAKAQKAIETKAKKEKQEAEKKVKAVKIGAYLDLGDDIIRIESVEEKDGKFKISGTTRLKKSLKVVSDTDSIKITDFKAFNSQEDDFKGKQVAELSEEQRILRNYLEIMGNPTAKLCQNLLIRINKFATEYKAANPKTPNPYREEINTIADLLKMYLNGKKGKIESSQVEDIENIIEKCEGERIFKTVIFVKRFAGWAKNTVSADSIKEFIADIELSRKRKLIKASDPLYDVVGEIEKILISMQSGGSYTFPNLGLGDVSMGLAGTRKMVKQWAKEAERRALAVIKKSPQRTAPQTHKASPVPQKKGFWSFFTK